MKTKHDVMTALAAAKPQVLEPTERPDESLRARDLDQILGWPRGASTARNSARSWRTVVPRRRMVAAGLGAILVAAALVAAVVAPTLRQAREGSAPTTGIAVAAGPGPVDARQFLLAVAARAEQLPAPGGAYWYEADRTSQVSTFGTSGKLGSKLGRGPAYTVELSQVTRSWLGSSRSRAVTNRNKPRFLTEQDRANWRAAGSPQLMIGAPPGGKPPPDPSVNDVGVPPRFLVGYQELTMNQLKRLPADPSRLAALLRVGLPAGSGPQIEALLFASAADLLNLPVSAQVRTAAFKVMAGVNGARLLGTITDPAGRKGTGVAFPESPHADRVFIVDQTTATLLAMEYVANDPSQLGARVPPGTAILTETWLATGWTDKLGQQP